MSDVGARPGGYRSIGQTRGSAGIDHIALIGSRHPSGVVFTVATQAITQGGRRNQDDSYPALAPSLLVSELPLVQLPSQKAKVSLQRSELLGWDLQSWQQNYCLHLQGFVFVQ